MECRQSEDFSNGFMVAEIFSRYYPLEVHMHSYDYGSREASKRDNWEQLNKIFKKMGFVVLNHEIDNIINCRAEEGAGPLLERIHSFLTGKRCKPREGEVEQFFVQQHASSKLWNTEASADASVDICELQDQSSCSERTTCSSNNSHYEGFCNSNQGDVTSVEDRYHDIALDPDYEHDSILGMDDPPSLIDLNAFSECAARVVLGGEVPKEELGDLLHTRIKGSNAVEKARQREIKRAAKLARAGGRGEDFTFGEVTHKAKVEAGLAFRSPNRKRTFKQYTLPDYRRQRQFGYVELGRLGPGDPTPELVVQRDKLVRIKEFGRHARSCNIMSHTNPTLVDFSKTLKVDLASTRKKALAFASTIPKPKVKIAAKQESEENLLPLQNLHALTELQILEAKHQSDKQHVEAIRRDLEHFLR